jgi:hypothetical protein
MKFHITWPTGLSEFIDHEAATIDALAMSMWGKATAELVALEHRVLIALHLETDAAEAEVMRLAAEEAAKLAADADGEAKRLAAEAQFCAEQEAAALAHQAAEALKAEEQAPASDDEPAAP